MHWGRGCGACWGVAIREETRRKGVPTLKRDGRGQRGAGIPSGSMKVNAPERKMQEEDSESETTCALQCHPLVTSLHSVFSNVHENWQRVIVAGAGSRQEQPA